MYQGLSIRQFWQSRYHLLGLYAVIALQAGSSLAAPAARLDDWRFYPEAIQLEINLSANTTPKYFYLSEPPRLVVDLPNTKLGNVATIQNYFGAIQRIRVSQLNETVTRIVLDLAAGNFGDPNQVQLQLVSRQNPTRWVLRPMITSYIRPTQPGNFQSLPNQVPSNYQQLPSTLYPITPNSQQPFVTVPPLNPSNSSQLPGSILPPASFPQPPSNFNSLPSQRSPNFSVPTMPNYQPNVSNIQVIEFGQPLPKPNY
ncbi:AMIN domain-containing protein [Nodularia spumigena CS-586/05]|uniref:AMIN domain-containing protein n=1 Tax=Nodularia spumigena TaxID=70799 RepID=UPI00232D90D9|nr:AMIN domain-containing protein [Nodularia spumigena]MDB9342699.1 AMIN domain-containing protein [Nodularia spumigena CS-588/06]MDB9368473.1 AMIN domain-containing protein [Nodularia spumigena CS-586/05]